MDELLDQNRIDYEGTILVPSEVLKYSGNSVSHGMPLCDGCWFFDNESVNCEEIGVACCQGIRDDDTNIIWVEEKS